MTSDGKKHFFPGETVARYFFNKYVVGGGKEDASNESRAEKGLLEEGAEQTGKHLLQ